MKLTDLTDDQLTAYIAAVDAINAGLCKGDKNFIVDEDEPVKAVLWDVYQDARWQIVVVDGEWVFSSNLKDPDPKRSAWLGPVERPT